MTQEENHSELYLKNLKTEGGFRLPDHYFEDLEIKMLANLAEPELNFGQNGGFKTPEEYFAGMEMAVLNKLALKKAKIIPFYQRSFFSLGISIAAGLLLVSMLFLYRMSDSPDIVKNTAVSNEEIINHLSNEDINAELLCEAGWCTEMEKLNKKENDELNNYIIENSDESLLMGEL